MPKDVLSDADLERVSRAHLPDYARWASANPSYSLLRHVRGSLTVEHLFAVVTILYPPLVLHAGLVFLAEGFTLAAYETWRARPGMTGAAIQRVMNHRHVRDISTSLDGAGREVLTGVAGLMKTFWEMKLVATCPGIPTTVEVHQSEDDVEVTMFAADCT